jgi:ribosomal protein S17E
MKVDKSINEQLKEITKLMLYDRNKTLMEQSMGGMLSPTYFSDPKNIKDFGDWVYEYRHITLPLAAIPLALWGGTLGLVVSGLIEVADFMLYVKEKDWLTASMAGAFLVIPGGQLINKIPAVKKFTSKTLGPAIKKIVNKLPLNKFEKELANQISENKNWLKENYIKYSKSIKNTVKSGKVAGKSSFLNRLLSKYGVKGLLNLVLRLVKMGVWSTKWTIRLTIGGVVATYTIIQLSKKLEEKFGKIKELDNFSDNEKKLTPEQIKQPVDEVWGKSEEQFLDNVNKVFEKYSEKELYDIALDIDLEIKDK